MGPSQGENEVGLMCRDSEQGARSGGCSHLTFNTPTLPLKGLTARLLRMIRGQRENDWKMSKEGGRSEEVSIEGKRGGGGRREEKQGQRTQRSGRKTERKWEEQTQGWVKNPG